MSKTTLTADCLGCLCLPKVVFVDTSFSRMLLCLSHLPLHPTPSALWSLQLPLGAAQDRAAKQGESREPARRDNRSTARDRLPASRGRLPTVEAKGVVIVIKFKQVVAGSLGSSVLLLMALTGATTMIMPMPCCPCFCSALWKTSS